MNEQELREHLQEMHECGLEGLLSMSLKDLEAEHRYAALRDERAGVAPHMHTAPRLTMTTHQEPEGEEEV